MKNSNPLDSRKRKALLLLPLLILPFLTMAFWALGGGRGTKESNEPTASGLNLTLPPAQLKDDGDANKMSFYDAAKRYASEGGDSTILPSLRTVEDTVREDSSDYPHAAPPAAGSRPAYRDPNEEKIYQKLDELNRQLSTTAPAPAARTVARTPARTGSAADQESLEQLEAALRTQTAGSADSDPELESLNSMMDKILDIQHPERVRERLKDAEGKVAKTSVPVSTARNESYISLLGLESDKSEANGFFGFEVNGDEAMDAGTIEAVVHGTQSLVQGSVVKLRLLQDLFVGSRAIPKGTFVFGTISLNGERAEMTISSIQYGGSLFPVQLEVYDVDGMPGLFIPGAITRDAAKTSADGAVQSFDLSLVDPSLKAQAASAGLNTVKSVLGRKAKLVRVTVKSGYRVYLKNKKQ